MGGEYVDVGENGRRLCEFCVEERDAYEWEESWTYGVRSEKNVLW